MRVHRSAGLFCFYYSVFSPLFGGHSGVVNSSLGLAGTFLLALALKTLDMISDSQPLRRKRLVAAAAAAGARSTR